MSRTLSHELLARPRHDDAARQRFILSLKGHLGRHVRPAAWRVYETHAIPHFKAAHGRAPTTRDEIRGEMNKEPVYQAWGALSRLAQEEMWHSTLEMIDADYDRIEKAAERLNYAEGKRGSIDIDPAYKVPSEVRRVNVHGQPGGYDLDLGEDDVVAGALYECGGAIYSQGVGIGAKESKGYRVIEFLRRKFPGFEPKRILEMGCSAGGQTVVYPPEFPHAEMHAIDAGPGLIRYAHARAESLGVVVHFHAMDAEHMTFPDRHFDLVVSHNMFHEVSARAMLPVLKEAYRVLKPGGVMLHQDLPVRAKDMPLFDQFMAEWEVYYNDEPFFMEYMEADFAKLLHDAGFKKNEIVNEFVDMKHAGKSGPQRWYVFGGRKSD